jgi:hypothetical protein
MRVPDDIKNCVVFLCVKIRDGNGMERDRYGGTAFFVSVLEGDQALAYVVTARHNIVRAGEWGDLYLRANTKDGKSKTIKVDGEWIVPENPSVDIAVKAIGRGFLEFDLVVIPSELFMTDERSKELDIGIGEDLFVIGLFTKRHGTEKNLPIVRVGHIASMTDEPFEDRYTGHKFDAYLAELRSIGGLSGSPVFVAPVGSATGQAYLIGLIRGHWNLERPAGALDFSEDELIAINTGIAQITPIQEVMSLLNRDDVIKNRRLLIKSIHGTDGFILD